MVPSSELDAIRRAITVPSQRTVTEAWVIADMTETHASGLRDATRNQFAIPAEEETKRSTQETMRYGMRVLAALLIVVALLWLAVQKNDTSVTLGVVTAIATIALILGADIPEIIRQLKKQVVGIPVSK